MEGEFLNSMLKVYPNPFNKFVNIELSLPFHAFVKIEILDVHGRIIHELVNGKLVTQTYRYSWHANLLHGIYLLNVEINEKQKIYKLINF